MASRIPLLSQHLNSIDALQIQAKRWSEAVPGAQGRKLQLFGVDGMVGASRINAMIWTRGCPGDYAAWAEMGLDGWSWEKVEPYFQRLENAIAHPDLKARGHQGVSSTGW
jgi:choline dehydrogenase-like flavoprotein